MPYDLTMLTEVGEVLWMRAAGQARLQRLAQLPRIQIVDLSPDGRTLIVELSHELLALVDLPDGDPRPLTQPPGSCVKASFSPDSPQLALLHLNNRGVGVSVRSAAGNQDSLVWFDHDAGWSNESAIAWSPSGSALAITWFGHDGQQEPSTMVIDVGGTKIGDLQTASILSPSNRSAWNHAGLHVADLLHMNLVAIGDQDAPRETEEAGLLTRSRTRFTRRASGEERIT